jgi:hypothetical protein
MLANSNRDALVAVGHASRIKGMRLTITFAIIATLMGMLVIYADGWKDRARQGRPEYGVSATEEP